MKEKVKIFLVGLSGITGINAVELIPSGFNLDTIIKLLQVAIGLVTLYKLLKKKKDANSPSR